MAEARVVMQAERSPTTCVGCGTHKGPFIDLQTTIYGFATDSGQIDVDGGLYICIGDATTSGCLIQWARMTGLMVDIDEYAARLGEIDELKVEIEGLKKLVRKKTITLEDAEALIGGIAG